MTANEERIGRVSLVHPTGNNVSRQVARALNETGLLEAFHTCVAVGSDSRNPLANRLFQRRRCPLPTRKLETYPWRELARLVTERFGVLPSFRRHEAGPFSVDQIYRGLDRSVAKKLLRHRPDAIYTFEDGALASFQAAKTLGVRRFYDLPIGYWRSARRIQTEESERRPEWKATMPALIDSETKLERKDRELELAETVIVASSFTAQTLKDSPVASHAPMVIPYGCPTPAESVPPTRASGDPLRVLYVGSLGQRKGVADLLEAVDSSGTAVELTLVGKRVAACAPLDQALKRHRWIESLPHEKILETMRRHDVLVFPSLFEGFGLVLTEALSQGLAVIATPHTCAPDIIKDGSEGFIVPIREPQTIADRLQRLHDDADLLESMRHRALETAREKTWERFRIALSQHVLTSLKS